MNAINHSDGEGENPQATCRRLPASTPAETVVFSTLGLVGSAAIVMAFISASFPPGSRTDLVSDTVKYVRSGQAIADVRTATAMAQYLLDHGAPVATNTLGPRATAANTPLAPTNSPTAEPKA